MESVLNLEDIVEDIKESQVLGLYFENQICGVCKALKPRFKNLLDKFPGIKSRSIDIDAVEGVSGEFGIYTLPGFILFIDGKETIREAGYININDVEGRIQRYMDMLED